MSYIGIDIGGTYIKGVLIDQESVVCRITKDTDDGNSLWKQSVLDVFQELKTKNNGDITGVGLSAPGITDVNNQKIQCMPGRLGGLEGFNWSEYLEQDVAVLNDAHAALIAESCWGVAKGVANVVMLTLGTGVGGGLLINHQLHQGFLQRAGHLGHICVDASSEDRDITGISGSLEDAVGEATLAKRSLGKYHSTQDLVLAYKAGDTWATYVWLTMLRKLALGIVSFCNTVSPDLVVLAGGITRAKEHLIQPLSTFLDLYEWRVAGQATRIKLAVSEEFAGAVGAALFARSPNSQTSKS